MIMSELADADGKSGRDRHSQPIPTPVCRQWDSECHYISGSMREKETHVVVRIEPPSVVVWQGATVRVVRTWTTPGGLRGIPQLPTESSVSFWWRIRTQREGASVAGSPTDRPAPRPTHIPLCRRARGQARSHCHNEPRPTEFWAGCGCFLPSSGYDWSRYY